MAAEDGLPPALDATDAKSDEDEAQDAPAEESDEAYGELVDFLADAKLEVQKAAADGLLAETENADFLNYCQRFPRKVSKQLMRLVERCEAKQAEAGAAIKAAEAKGGAVAREKALRAVAMEVSYAKAAAAAALQSLVNLSTSPKICDVLVSMNAPRRCAETLRSGWLEGRVSNANYHVMLLANLTTNEDAQKALCDDQSLVSFLVLAYVTKVPGPKGVENLKKEEKPSAGKEDDEEAPVDDLKDPLLCLGKALANLCAQAPGRKALSGKSASAALVRELAHRSRRPDAIRALRNICLDTDCHDTIVDSSGLLVKAMFFVYPWAKTDEEQRKALPEPVREALAEEGSALTGDVAVRCAMAGCLVGLAQTTQGREHISAFGYEEVIRAWETEESDEDTLLLLKEATRILNATEEEIKAAVDQELQSVVEEAAKASG
eukprot:TRINITY_DN111209_c0_g1_i1.p1 TRINITY_DN111209_c0_g1~~TRINITY_DN111209_c0_g1_i1.p1  ORF type:complete len:435 (+),score=147.57 TRINITY_DN111209_c0_g1_i1:63-1367(+)